MIKPSPRDVTILSPVIYNMNPKRLKEIIKISSLTITFGALIGVIVSSLFTLMGIHAGNDSVDTINFLNMKSWLTLVAVCVIEEVLFRGLLSLSKLSFAAWSTFALFVSFIFLSSPYTKTFTPANRAASALMCLALALILGCCVYKWFSMRAISWLKVNYNSLFWLTCIIFAVAHISNFPDRKAPIVFYLVLVLPQFFCGAILGLLRIRYGILVSIFVHFIYDAWAFLLVVDKHIRPTMASVAIDVILFLIFSYGLFQVSTLKNIVRELRSPKLYLEMHGS